MREALGSNKHGLKLSSGDKKKAIIMAVQAFPNYSNVMIAELIGCSESYVRKVKESENLEVRTGANPDERVIGKNGKPQARHKKPRKTDAEPSATPEESEKDEPATTVPIEPVNQPKDESASHEDSPAPDVFQGGDLKKKFASFIETIPSGYDMRAALYQDFVKSMIDSFSDDDSRLGFVNWCQTIHVRYPSQSR